MSTTEARPAESSGHEIGPNVWTIEGPRLTIHLTDEGRDFLNRLLHETGDSPEDLFRNALGFYRVIVDARKEGKSVGITTDPDALETEFVSG